MAGYDIKRELPRCYAAKNTEWAVVDVPRQRFIGVAGSGDPNTSPAYARAVEALYSVAYTIKFTSKRELGRDFVVGPLEGLWWADDPRDFVARAKDRWRWRMLLTQPDWIGDEVIDDSKRAAMAKKGLPTIADVQVEALTEGPSAQVLHVGSYDDEGPVLADLHDRWLAEHGMQMAGPHHEIYLGDHRRTEPSRWRTILRQPVRPRA